MKRYCIMLLLFFVFSVQTLFAQQFRKPITQDDINDNLLGLQTHPADDGYCVYAIFNKLNNSFLYFQDFMQNQMKLSEHGENDCQWKDEILTIQMTYIPPILFGDVDANAYKVYVQYSVFVIEKDFFVEKLDIWGNWESVAEIFVSYYPTKINIDYLKNNKTEIVTRYGNDRAVFSSEMANGRFIGRIKVRDEAGKNYKQFINEFELKKQNWKAKLETQRQDSIKQEEEKLQKFLLERKTKVYNLSENNQKAYDDLISQIQNESDAFLHNTDHPSSFYIKGAIKIEIDTSNVVRFNTEDVTTDAQEQLSKLIEKLATSIKAKAQQINGHLVNSEILFNINISYRTGRAFFKTVQSRELFNYHNDIVFSEPYPADDVQKEIKSKGWSGIGKYEVKYEVFSSENMQKKYNSTKINLTIIKFKR